MKAELRSTQARSSAATGRTAPLTAARLRHLPWPRAVRESSQQLTIDDSYEVGRLIVETIHGGSRNTRKSRKQWSLRRLQQEVLTEASFATLARCVQTYEICKRLGLEPPLGDVRVGHLLSLSHLDVRRQRQLLRQIAGQRLSVEALRSATGRKGPPRRRTPRIVKAVGYLAKCDLMDGIDACREWTARDRRRLAQSIGSVLRQLERVARRLEPA